MDRTRVRPAAVLLAVLGLVFLLAAPGAPTWAAPAPPDEEESPASEAPPIRPEPRRSVQPSPKPKGPGAPGLLELQVRALNARVEKQARELDAVKKENARLQEQIRLLYSIVNNLAGLQQGR